jgi:uncharacterized protein (DUF1015 family)
VPRNDNMKIKQKIIDQMQLDIQNLEVKKLFKINENGTKVRVRRDSENEYAVYLDGNFITTDATWEESFQLAMVLLNNKN